jgi:hypothetical protein
MLRNDEVVRYDKTLCGERISFTAYKDLGSVEVGTCCCLVCVDSKIGTVLPSYGCDREAANFIVSELHDKSAIRGEAALTKSADEVFNQAEDILAKTVLITRGLTNLTKTYQMDDR